MGRRGDGRADSMGTWGRQMMIKYSACKNLEDTQLNVWYIAAHACELNPGSDQGMRIYA